jgi:hypothetical protein
MMLRMTLLFVCLLPAGIVFAQDVSGSGVKKKKVELTKTDTREKKDAKDSLRFSGRSKPAAISVRSGKNEYIIIDWMKPSPGSITMKDGYLDIKLKIFSDSAVGYENVAVYQNGERVSAKMGTGGLLGQQSEFNYSDRISLVEGSNELIVQVTLGDRIGKSQPLVVHKRGQSVSLEPMGATVSSVDPLTSVYWWAPFDPVSMKGKPYTHKEELLEVKFKILTREPVSLSSLNIVHNGKILPPGPSAMLERDSQGNYTFSDNVKLNETSALNEIQLEVRAAHGVAVSEKLLINYSPFRPNLHILSVGTETNLQYTLKDAKDFAEMFSRQGGASGNRLFNRISLDTLFGARATAAEIKGTVEEFKIRYYTGAISADDVILAFISSHGFLLNGDFRVQGDDYAPARQRSTSVSFHDDIVNVLNQIPCKKVLIVDACHSGGARANPADINFEINKLNTVQQGMTVLASSSGEEQSYEDPQWENGAFTEAIIAGLKEGKADADKNGIVSLHELFSYVGPTVADIVRRIKDRPQHPLLVNDELGDVAIYVVDKESNQKP